MPESDRVDRAAELLERLLADADFRARFRAQPEAECRGAGFPDLADEIAQAGGSLQTLDLRESRSSLVGVLMAAAFEGMGVLELSHLAGGGLSGEAAAAAHRALTRSGMAAVRPAGAHPQHAAHLHPPHVPHAPNVAHAAASASPAPQQVPAAADPSAAPASADPQGAAPAVTGAPAGDAAAAPGAPSAPLPGAAAPAPGAAPPVTGDQGVPAPGTPAGTPPPSGQPGAPAAPAGEPWPDSPGAPASASPAHGGGWPQAPADQQGHAVARAAAAPDASMAPAAGGGGATTFQQLVGDPRITLPPGARADLLSGDIDPRFVPVLEKLAQEHPIGLSVVKTGHDQFVAGTNVVSNHFKGRALDIATVDGAPVGPGNAAAREVMTELANLDPAVRPSEIGGPWLISAPGFFSDADHQDHIHIGFDTPAPAEPQTPTQPPPGAPAPTQPPPGAPAPTQPPPGAPAPTQPPADGPAPAPAAPAAAPAADAHATIQFTAAGQAEHGSPAAQAAAEPRGAGPAGAGALHDAAAAGGGGGSSLDLVAAARDYPGDHASKAAIAQWMAEWAKRAGLPPELPVMAALVESGLTNVNYYADHDSLGFFQMRTSIWLRDFPDFPHRPELQLKWFIDHAVEVKRQRLAAGQTAFQSDQGQWGNWIADIERPAAQYRGRYQLRLAEARSLLGQPAGPAAPAGPAGPAVARAAAADPPAGGSPADAGPRSPRNTIGFTAVPAAGAGAGAGAGAVMPVAGSSITQTGTAPDALRQVFERAAALDDRHLPYLWGGGHQGPVADVQTVGPVDCSGAVSAVLGLNPRVSGAFEAWGEPGPGRSVTVYANDHHVLMEINGHFFGTSAANPGGGAGWIPRAHVPASYLAQFTARHPPGL